MSKLIVCYMIENDEDVFELSYNSIKDVADEIVIVDGNHYPEINGILKQEEIEKCMKHMYEGEVIFSPYPHEDLGADGKQRNKYLEYLKQKYLGDWCLVIDADEVIEFPENIKPTIEYLEKEGIDCANIRMKHYIGNLGQEDSTIEKHYVPRRLFRITKDLSYPEVEHNVLQGVQKVINVDSFINHHLGYCREIFRLKKKYENHCKKSNIHNKEFLEWWYHSHLFNEFPTTKVKTDNIPKVIKDFFKVNDDYLYFKDRGAEIKHAEMVRQWNEYFKPNSILDLGCGRGPYLRYWEMTTISYGLELSQWAIDNKICNSLIKQGSILNNEMAADLVTCLDVLEHIDEKDLQIALKNIYESGDNFLFSIPFEDDPNLYADKTHKIFKSKEWWLCELEKAGFKIKETPEHFYFRNQMVICSK